MPPPPVIELDEAAVVADLPTVLDNDSRDRYRRIFQAQAAGQFGQADAEIARLSDKTLMGYVGAQRLLSQGYPARYDELAAWLQEYNDHPDAPAVYRLALARRTPGSAELTPASFVDKTPGSPSFAAARTVTGVDASRAAELRARLQNMADDGGFNAAFVLLDRKSTVDIAGAAGSRTVARSHPHARPRGRLAEGRAGAGRGRHAARRQLDGRDVGLHARQHGRGGAPLRAGRRCAARPGLVVDAFRRLVLGRARQPAGRQSAEIRALSQARGAARPHLPWPDRAEGARHAHRAGLEDAARSIAAGPTCCATTAPARRALALLQLGATTAAERELFAGSIDADPQYIEAVLALAAKAALPGLSVRVGNANWDQRHNIKGYDGAMYPMPPWQPAGGFTVDRALVYGFMRQESAFNPKARSYVGAMGLMQLMPGTARLVATRYIPDHGGGNPYEPSTNVALGQAYISQLLNDVDNNLVRTAAGYNGGPGNVMRWDGSLNAGQDPLLYIASIPLHETRDFVQRVLANYWLYQIRLGQPTPSLDQIAAHEWPRYTPAGRAALTIPAM